MTLCNHIKTLNVVTLMFAVLEVLIKIIYDENPTITIVHSAEHP